VSIWPKEPAGRGRGNGPEGDVRLSSFCSPTESCIIPPTLAVMSFRRSASCIRLKNKCPDSLTSRESNRAIAVQFDTGHYLSGQIWLANLNKKRSISLYHSSATEPGGQGIDVSICARYHSDKLKPKDKTNLLSKLSSLTRPSPGGAQPLLGGLTKLQGNVDQGDGPQPCEVRVRL